MKTCLNCGKEFKPHNRSHKYCSRSCATEQIAPKRRKRKSYTCPVCGKGFEMKACKHPVYCSMKCAGKRSERRSQGIESAKNWQTANCEWCGKEFTRYAVTRVRFCSRECFSEWETEARKGANNPAYIHGQYTPDRGENWQQQRRLVLKRDGNKCQICRRKIGIKPYDHGIHHIRPYHEFNGDYLSANQLSNLITLCSKCHNKVEKGKLPCPKPLL